ncbi:hypothetical protein WICPIJ_003107 [Wickerhamomyces pijperi]|uniref:Uncharacterized protein n=1 Tax=Wickerhamomyces pijperi TaxID=599730 RepID=A0A9P8Q8A9_WICPI|nr:hypothetical protein WICPIJ_003107 [Wickerhamomyces pijperi]
MTTVNPKPNTTLHESKSKKFNTTPDGATFTKDLKAIFSIMIINLHLQEKSNKGHSRLNFLSRQTFPFSFTIQEAIETMGKLSLSIESSSTKTTVSYSIKEELANKLLTKFMSAKFIHTPADRTRAEPKDKVLLQPTPKGVAVLVNYCKTSGYKSSVEPIINSNFHSMELFCFERSPITDTIVYSEYFIHLLFIKFLGPSPNVWRSTNPPDELPDLDYKVGLEEDSFDFSNFAGQSFDFSTFQANQKNSSSSSSNSNKVPDQTSTNQASNNNSKSLMSSIISKKDSSSSSSKKASKESPFAHNFFTNPESDSHVQYYVSNKGVRLFEDYKFSDLKVKYCFTVKAGWQWIMDCTDIMNARQACTVLNLFCKYGLIEPIIVPPSTSTSKISYPPLKTSFYTLSKKGWGVSQWSKNSKSINITIAESEEINTSNLTNLTLSNQAVDSNSTDEEVSEGSILERLREQGGLNIQNVLHDPGIRYLFRNHLESEYCAENLDVYVDIKLFNKKMTLLKNLQVVLLKIKNNPDNQVRVKAHMVKLINECLSSAYNIYSSYITIGSPYQLNIDHSLRENITNTMVDRSSPLKTHFDESSMMFPPPMPEPDSTTIKKQTLPPSPLRNENSHCFTEQNTAKTASTAADDVKSLDTIISQTSNNFTKPNVKNTKKLSLDVERASSPSLPIADVYSSENVPKTPTTEDISQSLNLLLKLWPLFDNVGRQILKMLENDSFPKFIKSQNFKDVFGTANDV